MSTIVLLIIINTFEILTFKTFKTFFKNIKKLIFNKVLELTIKYTFSDIILSNKIIIYSDLVSIAKVIN